MVYHRGFTLIEILVVLTVLTILTTVVVVNFSKYRSAQQLRGGVESLVSILDDARAKTLSSLNSSQYGVHFQTGSVTLFTGASYASSNPTNKVFTLSPNVTITTIALNGGGSDIIFDRLTGQTNQYGSITLTSLSNTKVVTITKTGVISSI